MKKARLERIFHHGKCRYAIIAPYDREMLRLIRSIPGICYSGSHKCWYTDETEESLKNILYAFTGIAEVDTSSLPVPPSEIPHAGHPVTVFPEPAEEISLPAPAVTIRTRDDQSKADLQETGNQGQTMAFQVKRYDPVEFRIYENKLIIRFTGKYDGSWIEELRSYGKLQYDRFHKEFYLPWSKMSVDSLSDYFSGLGVEVRVIKQVVNEETAGKRKQFSEELHSRELTREGLQAVNTLKMYLEDNRYSRRTIETYTSVLEIFFRYFSMKLPEQIHQEEISNFMNDFIIKNGFSASYQNQMISAIKLYYEISGSRNIVPRLLERPRRGRALPKVFSKEEVTRILNAAGNTKHKLLLWMVYSCGLRRSEVTNILLTDIDRIRNIIHIREGKGGVDRIVPVPDKVWSKYDEYMESFQPVKYLFEGPSGGRYSSESVYNVFRQAMNKAGIKKDVGVHSLRHSFATHLHENGLDIRFIQELLGHKSTRTTEIYTHVSRRNLAIIKSPIEDLDLK